MNKIKRIRPVFFITCLTFCIILFSIYALASFSHVESDSTHKISQLPKLTRDHESKIKPERSTPKEEQLSKTSSDSHAAQQIALLNEQNTEDQYATSRGTEDRKAPTEVKPVAPAKEPTNTKVHTVQSAPVKTVSQYEKDLDLLARLVTAEAQGEPYEAKVAVGAVVMNRIKSGLWANTIKGVIYQNINGYYQFTPVVNGWINKPAEPESIKAAKAAMSGADPTNGAQFYYDVTVTNPWILSKPVSVQIGRMIYAY